MIALDVRQSSEMLGRWRVLLLAFCFTGCSALAQPVCGNVSARFTPDSLFAIGASSGGGTFSWTSNQQVVSQDAIPQLALMHFDNSFATTSGVNPISSAGAFYAPGKWGTSVGLSANGALSYPAQGMLSLQEGTIEMWIASQKNGSDPIYRQYDHPILQYTAANGDQLVVAESSSSPQLGFYAGPLVGGHFYGTGTGGSTTLNPGTWAAGEWHHLAVTYSPAQSRVRIYVDGTLQGEQNSTIVMPAANGNSLSLLGVNGRIGAFFIDELRFSSAEKTAAEILFDATRTDPFSDNEVFLPLTGLQPGSISYSTASSGSSTSCGSASLNFTGIPDPNAPLPPTNFLQPQQVGPFRWNGISYLDYKFTDPWFIGYPVATVDQIISEMKATGANLVKFTLNPGRLKNYTDNAYDPTIPFPSEGSYADILSFGRKLTSTGIHCLMTPFVAVESTIAGSSNTSTAQPTDPRAFMLQHIPRLVSLARLAEGMGCEYFQLFGDEFETYAAESAGASPPYSHPDLTDLWLQAITQIRAVFSGRITTESAWGEHGGPWTFNQIPELIAQMDVFGIGFGPSFTNHDDPTVAELVASYQQNAQGNKILQALSDMHTLYGKPLIIADSSFASFKGANILSEGVLYGQNSASQFTVDYLEQVNLYQAFFQAMPTLDPSWFLGGTFDSIDRLPYSYKDKYQPPYLGTLGESLRGKPAIQTLTSAYNSTRPQTTPANGWWYNPASPGTFYAIESENDVVRLAVLGFSSPGAAQWSLVRCVQTTPGTYVGTLEQYSGGQALNQPPAPPSGITDGPAVQIVFSGAATATLTIGTQSIPIQRYQFSSQWATPMLNAPRVGWWDLTTQSGRGYFVEVQGNTLMIGGLIYDSTGQPAWFTSAGPVDLSGNFSGRLTLCSLTAAQQPPSCETTSDTIRLAFSAPWRATLTLSNEAPVEIRRYRVAEIGWTGPVPSIALPNATFLGEAAIVNPASYALGLSPGSIATIFGTGLTRGVSGIVQASGASFPYSIRGTSVLVNGLPAPILGIANVNGVEEINFQAPWEVQGAPIPSMPLPQEPFIITKNPVATVVVMNNGTASPPMRAPYYTLQPAISTIDGTHAIAVRPDDSLVSAQSPARPGDVLTLYGTGFGPVTPQPPTGAPAGVSRMNTTPTFGIGGRSSTPLYAGLTPTALGLYQFNVIVPDGLGSGDLAAAINVSGQISNIFSIPVQGAANAPSELIQNGGFENPLTGNWFLYLNPNGAAVATLDRSTSVVHDGNDSAHISVATSGSSPGDVVFFQGGLPVVQGTTYVLQFWAMSNNARTLPFVLGKSGGNGQNYGLATSVAIGSKWQFYQIAFQATASATDGLLSFYLGTQTGDTWLDSVSLMPVIAATSPSN
jgi:uncharacterized protein (TIGR03437 family)